MKERILGIDTGTNSIGWAIVDYDKEAEDNKYTLVDKGVNIFQEGVKIEKGIESSRAAERTGYRRLRIGYWRRKVRKIALLRILIENNLCPQLSSEELRAWRTEKKYPLNDDFMLWQRTDEKANKNPYYYRHLCLTEKLDLKQERNRYILGRAIYHINQRRGFLSNRKEDTKESNGDVKKSIDELTTSMQEYGVEYLGQYFYMLYQKGEKIRNHYTSRLNHYEKELLKICEMQGLSPKLTDQLRRIIITQRPLKSQKYSVGKCVFESNKSRCPVSHPLYEQYRMYAFINNIKLQGPYDTELRPLTDEEKARIIPTFLLKSNKDFKFEKIAKILAKKSKRIGYYKDKAEYDYRFNFQLDTSVSGCPVIAHLSDIFGVKNDADEWLDRACEVYTLAGRKNRYEIMNDIWHALFFFDDEAKLKEWAKTKLQLEEKQAEAFSKIRITSDYASLSLKAIRKILPYMKQYGMIYSHAVFMANLSSVIPSCEMDSEALLPMLPREDADYIVEQFYNYDRIKKEREKEERERKERGEKEKEEDEKKKETKEGYVKDYVAIHFNLDDEAKAKLKKLYHPSMIETFPKVREETEGGYYQLGSPRTGSMRNPMAMHSLFRFRHIINTLLREGKIDKDTIIHIEFARELNDANKRAAVRRWQNAREAENKKFAEEIAKIISKEPTPVEVKKYRLWEEQNHICLYTGNTISLTELFSSNTYDIEHTIPRSVGGDSTEMNLTVCDSKYNRDVKRAQIPTQLANHEEILERIAHWKEKVDDLGKQIRKINTRGVSDREMKNRLIQKRHLLILEQDYWKGKYSRFTMTEVPDGFSRRQGVDISVISKYARLYLQSLFSPKNVHVVKGIATSDFRKIWGIQEEYEKKQRVNHCHHAIDAITIACICKAEYDKLAQYYHNEELVHWGESKERPTFPKPWKTFTQDVKHIEDSLLVSHYTADNMGKQARKKILKDGKPTGKYIQGDTARSSLHQDTYYGAIKRNEEICYVVRKPIDTIGEKDIKNIVDDAVRQKVQEAFDKYGSTKEALKEKDVWMNKEKGIRINKVRVYAHITQTLDIRNHRDVSQKEYKRTFHVVNDSNYVMGIYVGIDKKGKEKRDFQLVNCLEATNHCNDKSKKEGMLPLVKGGFALKMKLKVGTMVILYESKPEEIYSADKKEISKRLYKVYGMDLFGRIKLSFHQEARPSGDIKAKNGSYKQGEEERPRIVMYYSYINALVEGQDFKMNDIGEITFRDHD